MANEVSFKILGDASGLEKELQNVSATFQTVGKIASAAFVASGAAIAFAAKAAYSAEKSTNILSQAIKNQGLEVEKLLPHLNAYAYQLQQKSQLDDDDIKKIQATYLAYGLQGKALDDITKATIDYAEGTGKSVEGAAILIGSAVEGATNTIRGLKLNIAAVTDVQSRAAIITESLSSKFDKQSEAVIKGYGSFAVLKNNVVDAFGAIGAKLEPAIVTLGQAFNNIVFLFNNNPVFVNLAANALVLTAALSGVVAAISAVIVGMISLHLTQIPAVIKAFNGLKAALLLSPPLRAAVIMLTVLSAAFTAFATAWATNLGDMQRKTGQFFEFLKIGFKDSIGYFENFSSDFMTVLSYLLEQAGVLVRDLLRVVFILPFKAMVDSVNFLLKTIGKEPIKIDWIDNLAADVGDAWDMAGERVARAKAEMSKPGAGATDKGAGNNEAELAKMKELEEMQREHAAAIVAIRRAGMDAQGELDINARETALINMQEQFDAERDVKIAKLEAEAEFLDSMGILTAEKKAELQAMTEAVNTDFDSREAARKDALLINETSFGGKMAKLNAMLNAEKVKQFSATLGQISTLQNSNNQTMITIGKASGIAQATVNTAVGITEAWKLGPILGPILAPLVALAGAVQIATIAGVSYAVGSDYIPNDMAANIHKGEAIVPARENQFLQSGKLVLSSPSAANGGATVVYNNSFNIEGILIGGVDELAEKLHRIQTENITNRAWLPLPAGA